MPVCGGEVHNPLRCILRVAKVHPKEQAKADLGTEGLHEGVQGDLTSVIKSKIRISKDLTYVNKRFIQVYRNTPHLLSRVL